MVFDRKNWGSLVRFFWCNLYFGSTLIGFLSYIGLSVSHDSHFLGKLLNRFVVLSPRIRRAHSGQLVASRQKRNQYDQQQAKDGSTDPGAFWSHYVGPIP